jgi:glucosamine kinase
MKLFLGIDGGGTKTECAVGNEVEVLGRFTAGTSKIQRVARETAANSLRAAVQGALYAARIQPDEISYSCIGIAGASQPEVIEFVTEVTSTLVPGGLQIVGDNVIAHEAAFHGGPGVLVIAGTGSIAFGRNERGETARAGGWGSIISDEGSGYWIGKTAVASAMRAYDSGQSTALVDKIMKQWRIATREDIVRLANSTPPPNFAALFPEVLAAADKGDVLARDILNRAGTELAAIAKVVIRRLWPGQHEIHLAGSGGVLRHSHHVRQILQNVVRAERPQAIYDDKIIDPIEGALFLARKYSAEAQAERA